MSDITSESRGLLALIEAEGLHQLYIPESFRELEGLLEAEKAEQAGWPREPVTEFRALTGDPRNEISTGGESGGDTGGGDTGGATGGTTDTGDAGGGPVTMEKMFQAFEGFRGDVVKRFDGLEQRIPADELEDDEDLEDDEPAQQSPTFFDPRRFSDEDFDEHGQLTREAQTRELQAMMQRTVAEALAPERQAQADRDRTSRANALEQRHPIFADAEKRQPILRAAQEAAGRMASVAGNPALRDMWRDPDFLEQTYLGMVGSKALAGETVAGGGGGQEVSLERGGSAGPAGGGGGDGGKSIAQSIVKLAGSSKYRLGS